jgi:chorismate synthase
MRGNSFGKLLSITTFGESHGEAIGVIIDGMPAQIEVSMQDLIIELDRRRPGRLKVSTSRVEQDSPIILSGIFENKTLGTPIAVMVKNSNQKSSDYDQLKDQYRPGHADKTTMLKFGHRDHRGGGRASGRETLSRVIGGYFASLIVPQIKFLSGISRVGPIHCEEINFNSKSAIGLLDQNLDSSVEELLLSYKSSGESCGGEVFVKIENCPARLGEPVFDKLKADLGKSLLSIGTCMGVSFGRGQDFSHLLGTEISKDSKNFGGIEGGISNSEDILIQLVFKAPSTIGEKAKQGRHDPCILPRVLPVVESMCKLVIADHYLRQNAYQIKSPTNN